MVDAGFRTIMDAVGKGAAGGVLAGLTNSMGSLGSLSASVKFSYVCCVCKKDENGEVTYVWGEVKSVVKPVKGNGNQSDLGAGMDDDAPTVFNLGGGGKTGKIFAGGLARAIKAAISEAKKDCKGE